MFLTNIPRSGSYSEHLVLSYYNTDFPNCPVLEHLPPAAVGAA